MQREFKEEEAVNDKCDIHFHPNDCREELEVKMLLLRTAIYAQISIQIGKPSVCSAKQSL